MGNSDIIGSLDCPYVFYFGKTTCTNKSEPGLQKIRLKLFITAYFWRGKYEETITRTKILSLVISSLGLAMVVGLAFDGLNPMGLLYAALAAVVYTLYIILSNKLVGTVNPRKRGKKVLHELCCPFAPGSLRLASYGEYKRSWYEPP
ncbi:MAG: hypothetical protein M0Z31_08800 [Clostridia bacterium]|nr:hypothetical protein [Clostridia bacterium]